MSEKKYRGKGYGWQTDEEFSKSRQTSEAFSRQFSPGCGPIIILLNLFFWGIIGLPLELYDLIFDVTDINDEKIIITVIGLICFPLFFVYRKKLIRKIKDYWL